MSMIKICLCHSVSMFCSFTVIDHLMKGNYNALSLWIQSSLFICHNISSHIIFILTSSFFCFFLIHFISVSCNCFGTLFQFSLILWFLSQTQSHCFKYTLSTSSFFFLFCPLLSALFCPIASLFTLLYTPAYRLHFFPLLPLIPCILFYTKGL